ncbi:hypothetical protein DACRYDRAFT_20271 [Dacryopinax primogenitus]|uniref:BAH domain-containing protein n=1 Tax=Dacryopinax primogenitus (strain DJM 731) TaxID=1858805 RepID=M5GFY9_DACPD|nr:uncharacterized protein DACRYDRAFT_20271 [Dacryopinax primogenitus]EJU04573.1 hypothetical protein DACRYDRAFT_20271 [Dacryopinax primogenitus]
MMQVMRIRYRSPKAKTWVTYAVGDNVLFVPPGEEVTANARFGIKDTDLWRARILEIRIPNDGCITGASNTDSESDGSSVDVSDSENSTSEGSGNFAITETDGGPVIPVKHSYVKIAWYYSPSYYDTLSVPARLRGYQPSDFGERELICTPDHFDIQHVCTLNGHEEIYPFNERTCEVEDVPDGAYYYRSSFLTREREWKIDPPKYHCICAQTYKLYDDKAMHYCPRPGCHTWYHEGCLKSHSNRSYHSALSDLEEQWEMAIDATRLKPMREELEAAIDSSLPERNPISEDMIAEVRRLARQPIVRGPPHSTIGNGPIVLRARFVLRQLREKLEMPDKLDFVKRKMVKRHLPGGGTSSMMRKRCKMEKFEAKKLKSGEGYKYWAYKCPKCNGPI